MLSIESMVDVNGVANSSADSFEMRIPPKLTSSIKKFVKDKHLLPYFKKCINPPSTRQSEAVSHTMKYLTWECLKAPGCTDMRWVCPYDKYTHDELLTTLINTDFEVVGAEIASVSNV